MITNSVVEGSSPFVGARPFGSGDEPIFFGRKQEISDVVRLWQDGRLTLLRGYAGVGKTSLICAGVMPQLRAEGERVLPIGRVWRRNVVPAAAFPGQNAFTLALLSSWFPDESPAAIAGLTILDYLRRHTSKDRFGLPVRTFGAIDQADLVFRGQVKDERQRRRFLDQLALAIRAEPNLHLLLVMRENHPDEIQALESELPRPTSNVYTLDAFGREAAVGAVRGPIEARGGELALGVAESLVDEFRTVRIPKALPARQIPKVAPALLQLVCSQLWSDLLTGPDISPERLAADIDRVLTDHWGEVLATVAAYHRTSPAKIVEWFLAAFAEHDGSTGTTTEEAGTVVPEEVLHAVEDHHLLRVDLRSGQRLYVPHHPRTTDPARRLAGGVRYPVLSLEPSEQLRAAERALCKGATDLARYHAEAVIRACGGKELRLEAEAERLLGNIAYERGERERTAEHHGLAAKHYGQAASLFEVLQDAHAVGLLQTALGRLLMDDNTPRSIWQLRTAANRLPNDLVIQVALAQALWQAGQARGALALLDSVLARDGDTLEALRARGEILADQGKPDLALRDLRRIDHRDRPSTHAAWLLATIACRQNGTSLPGEAEPEKEIERLTEQAAENGPILLRIARALDLRGDRKDAAKLAARAATASHPSLPPHLHDQAHRLKEPMTHDR